MRFQNILALLVLTAAIGGCSREPAASKAASTDSAPSANNGVAMSKAELATKADIPIYPGATVPEGQSKVTSSSAETRYEIDMVTPDSVDKVARFYKDTLHLDRQGSGGTADMMGVTPKGELARIKIESKGGKTTIQAVSVDEPKTKP